MYVPATLLALFLALPHLFVAYCTNKAITLLLVDRSSGAMNGLRKAIQKLVPYLYFQCSNYNYYSDQEIAFHCTGMTELHSLLVPVHFSGR